VEALRYNYLAKYPQHTPRASQRHRVLVLGDVLRASTERMLGLLAEAVGRLTTDAAYTLKLHPLKLHPNAPIDVHRYPMMNLQVTANPLSALLNDCGVVVASAATAAAVEAYIAGVPVGRLTSVPYAIGLA
jgi:surface carbohydrate biosynthesis protein (TIGR04326 family)